ncbi:hypothetical protein [Algoriphagus zhangzhouensis]|uniref:Uncharacterized protein n=1 Tax=Algoriphagus zhangzhouensis TaxID=1073327 RepID=A0A1M7ZJP2_9BACT|nr:hypothetical protein [Algoriphagus zhangzhouensis]TDY43554.1 hypothetical protein A8938_3653 [Algoriphagus zhangzhouensis]SHO65019.1 hypothetical protein SAMN04488108_3807 [Algoriphagus zhangzhouensis]
MQGKIAIALIFLCCIQSCNYRAGSKIQFLEGKWEWMGFYNNGQLKCDTLYTSNVVNFGPNPDEIDEIYGCTDSGTYVHRYLKDELIGVEFSTKVRISEFFLLNKSEGEFSDIEIDSKNEGSMINFSEQTFSIVGDTLVFKDFGIETKVVIEKISKNELILKFENGDTSRFKKLETDS